MSKNENEKIKSSTLGTKKLFLNSITKTRNRGSTINDINKKSNNVSKKFFMRKIIINTQIKK